MDQSGFTQQLHSFTAAVNKTTSPVVMGTDSQSQRAAVAHATTSGHRGRQNPPGLNYEGYRRQQEEVNAKFLSRSRMIDGCQFESCYLYLHHVIVVRRPSCPSGTHAAVLPLWRQV